MNPDSESLRILTVLVIVVAFASTALASAASARAARRRQTLPLRALPAADGIPLLVGSAIEADRPVHVSLGSASIGGASTVLALAAAEAAYQIAAQAAVGSRPVLLTVSGTAALALGYGVLRRAYQQRDRLDRFTRTSVRWLPATDRTLGFAAAASALAGERAGGYVLVGGFGAEIALLLEAARRQGARSIAGSDQLEAQAIAYVLADHALLGEDVFALGAYAAPTPSAAQVGSLIALDTLRWLLIAGLLAASALVLREPISAALGGLPGGG